MPLLSRPVITWASQPWSQSLIKISGIGAFSGCTCTQKNQFIFKVFSSEKNSFELFSNLKDILLLFSPLPVRLPQWSSRPWQDLLQQAKSYVLGTFRDDGKLTSYGFDKIGDEFVMFWVMMKMIIIWKRTYFWISNVWLAEMVKTLHQSPALLEKFKACGSWASSRICPARQELLSSWFRPGPIWALEMGWKMLENLQDTNL